MAELTSVVAEIAALACRYFGRPGMATLHVFKLPSERKLQDINWLVQPRIPPHSCGTQFAPLSVAMTIRIDVESEEAVVILRVAGVLAGSAIKQLSDVCEPIEGHYALDLSKLKLADDAGIRLLRSLREEGVEIRGASVFIKYLLNDRSESTLKRI